MNATRRKSAFTLIELLVVVAIIALLISILLPSLSKARAQARTTLCASRIGQLGKAVIIYCDDFDGTTPFLGRGWEMCDNTDLLAKEWPRGSGKTILDWAYDEDWCIPNPPDYWNGFQVEGDWPDEAQIRNGSLFSYTRFESLYRCPEFERTANKSQNEFNYTRSVLARKWYHLGDPEGAEGSMFMAVDDDNWAGQPGLVLKTDQAYAPAKLHMLADERWDKHCAGWEFNTAGGGLIDDQITHQWLGADPIFGPLGNEIGQYHGSKKYSPVIPEAVRESESVPQIKSGNCLFYDGHAALDTDPLPDRMVEFAEAQVIEGLFNWIYANVFAQRGLSPEEVVFGNPLE